MHKLTSPSSSDAIQGRYRQLTTQDYFLPEYTRTNRVHEESYEPDIFMSQIEYFEDKVSIVSLH